MHLNKDFSHVEEVVKLNLFRSRLFDYRIQIQK